MVWVMLRRRATQSQQKLRCGTPRIGVAHAYSNTQGTSLLNIFRSTFILATSPLMISYDNYMAENMAIQYSAGRERVGALN